MRSRLMYDLGLPYQMRSQGKLPSNVARDGQQMLQAYLGLVHK